MMITLNIMCAVVDVVIIAILLITTSTNAYFQRYCFKSSSSSSITKSSPSTSPSPSLKKSYITVNQYNIYNLIILRYNKIARYSNNRQFKSLRLYSSKKQQSDDINDKNITDDVQYNEVWFKRYLNGDDVINVSSILLNNTLSDLIEDNNFMNSNLFLSPKTTISSPLDSSSSQSSALSSESIETTTSSTTITKKTRTKLPLPFMNIEKLGLIGNWQEKYGNFILKPTNSSGTKPIGVIHFLGGAFAGAAPHLTYRYLLENLANEGYVIITTPYRLELDYIKSCDGILIKFDKIARDLAIEYGPLPVIGIGHSCGALLQALITSLFPDTPRAVNILISYNNKPIIEAIPAFNEVVLPISQFIMSNSNQNSIQVRKSISSSRIFLQDLFQIYTESNIAPKFISTEILPLLKQSVEILDQLPPLLLEIASGKNEFEPTPTDTKEVCRRMYRARQTLVIKYNNDNIDESDDIVKVLREANTIMRMKRPMVEMLVDFKELSGSHITPLTPNLLFDLSKLIENSELSFLKFVSSPLLNLLNPKRSKVLRDVMKTIDDTNQEIIQFLDVNVKNS